KPDYLALIGSVRDLDRLDEVFSTYHPDIIFHAAAHKHVPLVEDSPYESIKNNIKGTYNVAYMANKYKAQKMVLISTDKAVNPTNVMGASKRFCEMVVEAWNNESKTTDYSMVRFGNVLGSHGSVIPLFKKQILEGGPVTVTSPEITRFFMTIPEACSLVIQSGAYAKGGEKFILDMGEPVKIVDLAKNLIKLSGLELDKDIKIEFTGLRPGEKLYEELLLKTANATKTENEKIFVEYSKNPLSLKKIDEIIEHLVSIGHKNKMILDYLKELEIIKNDNDNEVK
nr:polysaccharide biosynthesis protein [Clostridia bacterium]